MQVVDVSVVIAPYLESVVRGRRIAVIGDATRPLAPALLDRGARLVHVYDPDPARVAEVLARRGSSRTLMTAPLPEGDVAVRDGAFDAVVVPDLTIFDPVDTAVARARKLVAAHGHAVFISPNPEFPPSDIAIPRDRLLSYYELYDVVALQFPEVRMLGQAPFSGYVIADFAPDGEPDVVVDTSLVDRESQEPRWFIALGAQQPRRLDAYAIIQVPSNFERVESGAPEATHLQDRITELEAALEKALEKAPEKAPEKKEEHAVPIVPRLPVANERVEALEASLREKAEVLRRAESRAGDSHVRAEQLETKVRDLEDELRHQRDRAFRLSNDVEAEKKQRTKAELELRMVRSKSDMPPTKIDVLRAESARLTGEVEKANDRVKALELELAGLHDRLATTQRELAATRDELEDLRASKKQLGDRVVDLMRDVAGRDARIEELDHTVVNLQEAAGDDSLEQAADEARRAQRRAELALEDLRNERDEAVARATRERDEVRAKLAKLEGARSEVDAAVVRANEARREAQVSLQAALSSLQQREAELAALSAQRSEGSNLRKDRDEAQAALDTLRLEQERDISALESTLRERGREIQRLRNDLAHHEGLVRELLGRLEVSEMMGKSTARGNNHDLRARLQDLAASSARREGELQQAQWRIAELEQKIRESGGPCSAAGEASELEHALFAAQNELDALRQALAAERKLRLRAEKNVAGSHFVDIQEQAVMEAQAEPDPDPG